MQVQDEVGACKHMAQHDTALHLSLEPRGSSMRLHAAVHHSLRRNTLCTILLHMNVQAIADMLWHQTGLSKLLKSYRVDGQTAVGCNPNIRFYRSDTMQILIPRRIAQGCFCHA